MSYPIDAPNLPPTLSLPKLDSNLEVTDQALPEITTVVTPPVTSPDVASLHVGKQEMPQPLFARTRNLEPAVSFSPKDEQMLQRPEFAEVLLSGAEQTDGGAVDNSLGGVVANEIIEDSGVSPADGVAEIGVAEVNVSESLLDSLESEQQESELLKNTLNVVDSGFLEPEEQLTEPSDETVLADTETVEGAEELKNLEEGETVELNAPNATAENDAVEADERLSQSEVFDVFPVGINVNERSVLPGELVKGKIDGSDAIDFSNWLIPYDVVVQALRLQVDVDSDGQLEIRSPGLVTRLDPDSIRTDDDLGLVFSVQDLQDQFNVVAEFDISEYAVRLNPPWVVGGRGARLFRTSEVQLEGLPLVAAPQSTITAFEQELDVVSIGDRDTTYQGDFSAVGTLWNGSWYLSVDQPEFSDSRSWDLAEAQYFRPSDRFDLVLGSQGPFWDSAGSNDLWGATYVQRQGYDPKDQRNGAADVGQRLQSGNQIGRMITGEAEPGTLVQLTEGFSNRVIDQVLVDSSGLYRFNEVDVGRDILSRNYQVLLYPNGRLTDLPEVRVVSFSDVAGQLPAGASAWVASAGWQRDAGNSFLGDFGEPRGGLAYRWGVSEELTLGVGAVYDENFQGLGELFYQPTDIPLQVAAQVLTADDEGTWDVDAVVRYDPSDDLSTRFISNRFERRFNVDLQLSPEVTLLGIASDREAEAVGAQVAFGGEDAFTFARTTINTDGNFRWNFLQNLGDLEIDSRGDEVSTLSEVSYNLSGSNAFDSGHSVFTNYETRSQENSGNLVSTGWRYRSRERATDGNFAWEAQLGYATGSEGSGVIASAQTTIVPGLLLRARYQGVSVTSSDDSFRLELVSSINSQRGFRPGDRRTDFLRPQGGILVEPYFDRNNNGQRDKAEEFYTEDADLLLALNNESIRTYRPEINDDGVLMRTAPGIYRLDVDPAGFPLDWQADAGAMAVEVVPGSYTPVSIPLVPAYTFIGIVTDASGNPVAGARVEAISEDGSSRRFSVTNDAGVYALERLEQGNYQLQINGQPAEPGSVILTEETEFYQELNLQAPAAIK
ncbi:hypothetical protein N836_28025 [Leptolyngbya sp. Heron Island J]|uniref:carboxypeptidase-like regulatory domain-containing protein n=1 Tax=Leptolyngbya sp. Heron Island J TaxID=1385935 RepID=UPI0003B9CCF9|nr:carboxypeptidase regulatory-like domain-containing protein [Leptolyngbya sp. Heron Island J]ESA32005.1 hypothetical protein N836_28025 [Leptolyngbya sp. Heron Island J]